MAQKRTPKRRKKPRSSAANESSSSSSPSGGGGGGVLQSLRSGFRRAVGAEESQKKPSTLSNIGWGVLFAVAIGLLIYRWFFQGS